MTKCVILDRDGVINHDSDDYIKTPDEWVAIDGALEAIAKLNKAGFLVAMATNQAGPARGIFPRESLGLIFEKLHRELAVVGGHIDHTAMCLHHPNEDCACRKPKPGMLLEVAEHLPIDLSDTIFIGDSYKDIEAARAVSATPMLVKTGKGMRTLEVHPELEESIAIFDNLANAVEFILS